jgi:hypothetical protein
MADLSNLLGAVYGDASEPERDADGPPVPVERAADERTPAVPDWADDDHLDAAFAEWNPGPSAEAHTEERAFVTDEPVHALPLADDLAAALSEALVAVDEPDRDTFTSGYDTDEDEGPDDDVAEFPPLVQVPVTPERPSEHRRVAAAELSAAAGPLPLAPPPPVDDFDDEEEAEEQHHEPLSVAVAAAAQEPTVARAWERADDDILPAGRGRKFFSLSLRRG